VLSCVVLINSVLQWAARINGAASLVAAPANRRCAVLDAFRTHSPAVITARRILTKLNLLCTQICGDGRPDVGLCPAHLVSVFFPSNKNTRQPFSGTAERIFMKLLPNDTGENGVSNVVPPPGE